MHFSLKAHLMRRWRILTISPRHIHGNYFCWGFTASFIACIYAQNFSAVLTAHCCCTKHRICNTLLPTLISIQCILELNKQKNLIHSKSNYDLIGPFLQAQKKTAWGTQSTLLLVGPFFPMKRPASFTSLPLSIPARDGEIPLAL